MSFGSNNYVLVYNYKSNGEPDEHFTDKANHKFL